MLRKDPNDLQSTIARTYPFDLCGVTTSWLANANGCSTRTVRRRRISSRAPASATPKILADMSIELAQEMTRLRPPRGLIPLWSRMAIAELAARGTSYTELMSIFGVGRSTVYRAIHCPTAAYCPLSGRRTLTKAQQAIRGGQTGCITEAPDPALSR